MGGPVRWREAMAAALYGPSGFFVTPGAGPVAAFRTSVHASPLFAAAMLRLLRDVDDSLGKPDPFDLVDVGAGRGELLTEMLSGAPDALARRLRLTAVELAPRPTGLPEEIRWTDKPPTRIAGLLLATEWLDNVPLDVATVDEADDVRYVLVDPGTGEESLGPGVSADDVAWLRRWWPLAGAPAGTRAEVGGPRDLAWAGAVARLARGLAVAVDYGHTRERRPPLGTLTGYRAGRETAPTPDGSRDITAHVAVDSAVTRAGGLAVHQHHALRALGVRGDRPQLSLASRDPAGYVRALATASAAAELTDPAGLGDHFWLVRPVGVELPPGLATAAALHGRRYG